MLHVCHNTTMKCLNFKTPFEKKTKTKTKTNKKTLKNPGFILMLDDKNEPYTYMEM